MNYGATSISSLRELHEAIQRCVDEDNNTPLGVDKPYGVGEHSDWKKHLDQIESELKKRNQSFTPIVLPKVIQIKPTPCAAILYERIRIRLAEEDNLSADAIKPFGVRQFPDWRRLSEELETELDSLNHSYQKINW